MQRLEPLLLPLARELFSSDGDRGDPATGFDSTHAFVVKYRADEDSHLDVHTDDDGDSVSSTSRRWRELCHRALTSQ